MFNLRQLNTGSSFTGGSGEPNAPWSTGLNFRAPSNLLGNIGEPLDHSQAERYARGTGAAFEQSLSCTTHSYRADIEGGNQESVRRLSSVLPSGNAPSQADISEAFEVTFWCLLDTVHADVV